MDFKKINFRENRYMLPAIGLLPILFIAYQICGLTGSTTEKKSELMVTDSLNMSLPDAEVNPLKTKYDEIADNLSGDSYTALREMEGDTTAVSDKNLYSEGEMNKIDSINMRDRAQAEELEKLRLRLSEMNNSHRNKYAGMGSGTSYRTQEQEDMESYAQTLNRIKQRNKMAQDILNGNDDDTKKADNAKKTANDADKTSEQFLNMMKQQNKKEDNKEKIEIVRKLPEKNADQFNTVSEQHDVDNTLIRAMVDETLKVKDGGRIRLKLLDDIIINKIKLMKGTYLYATVTGFTEQRVKATVTSILTGSKFIKISLSIYDNDGMEGFYVPQSNFRDFLKEAGSSAAGQNININSGSYGTTVSAEAIALQTLQNSMNSASQAVSSNIRKNKARIKYNTVVYLINTSQNN